MAENNSRIADKAIRDLIAEGRFAEAVAPCQAAVAAGSSYAQLIMGWMHQGGRGVPVDLRLAEEWFRKAAASSTSGEAEFYLGTIARQRGEHADTLRWFEKSDALGFAPAAYEIGRMWFFGEGRPVDREKAFTYFEKAARQGHLFAQRNVARGMMSGRSGLVGRLSGGLLFVKVLLRAVKVGWADPDSERLFRQ